jgi:hypothetical protein
MAWHSPAPSSNVVPAGRTHRLSRFRPRIESALAILTHTSPQLVDNDQALVCGVLQDVRRLLHLRIRG